MATFFISTDTNYADIVGIANGDIIDMQQDAKLTISESTIIFDGIFNNNLSRTVDVVNTSTSSPIFIPFQDSGSFFSCGGGTWRMRGDWITLGVSDGTAGQVFDLPVDALGSRYEEIAYVKAGTESWAYVSDISDDFTDDRGKVFLHDTTATGSFSGGQITFGNGVNGAIPPLGVDIKVANIQIKANNAAFNPSGGTLDWQISLISGNPDWNAGGRYLFDEVGVFDAEDILQASDFSFSVVDNFVVVGDAANTRFKFSRGTWDNILLVSNSASSTECLQDESQSYFVGTATSIFRNPRNTTFARVRLNLNNSTIQHLRIFTGDDVALSFGDKSNGVIEKLTYSTRSLRSQSVLYGIVLASLESVNMTINQMVHYGSESQNEISRPIRNFGCENLTIRNWVTPSDFSAARLLEVNQISSFTGEDWVINGTISDTGGRDLNTYSGVGVDLRNVIMPDEVDCGNQASINMNWDVVYLEGNTPSVGRNSRSVTTRSNTAGTSGYVGLQPYYDANDPATSIISGTADAYLFTDTRFHLADTVTEIEIETNNIGGVESFDTVSVGGNNTGVFSRTYDMRTEEGSYSGVFVAMTAVNLEASRAALADYDSDEGLRIKYRVIKTSGGVGEYRIETISIGCTFDATYRWKQELADITIAFNGGLLAGDYIRVEDNLGVTRSYTQATSSHEDIVFSGSNAGSGWRYAVDREGFTPDVGDLTLIAGATIPVSVSLNPYTFRDGTVMYSLSTNPAVSVSFDLVTPEARITINDVKAHPQDVFNAAENALITEDGMAWHAQQGSVVEWDDIVQGGRQLYLGANWRLFGIGLNAGVDAIVAAVDDQIFAVGSSQMNIGAAYKEYTQDDRDRDESIKTRVDSIPVNPLLDDDVRLDGYSTFDPSMDTVEGSETYDEALRLIRAEAAGKVSVSGNDVSFRDAQDTKDRIVANTDEDGQRLTITVDGS